MAAAAEAGRQMAQDDRLNKRQRRAVVRAFKEQLLPSGHPGRRKTKRITRAYQDWLAGVRGVALFRKTIPRWEKLGYYARQIKSRRLMSSIRARHRREKKRADKNRICSPNKSSE
jgi:hypothetical protein